MFKIISNLRGLVLNDVVNCNQHAAALFHTSPVLDKLWNARNLGPRKFELHNKTMFEPQLPEEAPRPAVSDNCH
jgi:hypothetical protein